MICEHCDGSGEGMTVGTICPVCHGLGEVPSAYDPDERDGPEFEND